MKFLLNFGLLAVFFLSSFVSESHAGIPQQSACIKFYKPSKILPNGRRVWLRHEPKAIGDSVEPKYKPKGRVVELKEAEVSNQCQTSECYLFAAINFINTFNKNRKNTTAPLISEPYLVAHKFLEHIKEGLRLGIENPELIHDLEGGFSYEAFHLTRKVGLVARDAWEPSVPLESWGTDEIYKTLGQKIPSNHKKLVKLAEKHGSWSAKEVKEEYEKFYFELAETILKFSGPLPTEFQYQGRNYTPSSFEHQFGIPRLTTFYMHNTGEYSIPKNLGMVLKDAFTQEGGRYRVHNHVDDSMVMSIRDYLDNGLPAIIDVSWSGDAHALLVVGYEINDANEVVRFKAMNSWGSDFGNNGFAWYTPEDVIKNTTSTYRIDKPDGGH